MPETVMAQDRKKSTCMKWGCAAGLILFAGTLAFSQATGDQPHLFLTQSDFERIRKLADEQPWAKQEEKKILDEAAAFPKSYEESFGLKSVELPPEGGQWGHYYVCPESGRALVFHPPDRSVCPDTGKVFTGYPYDQIVYATRANALGSATLNLALAFRLSGHHQYAEESASLLKAYADRYLSYPIHDNHGVVAPSGARVFSQTLDESIWLIEMAWAYDLIRGTDVLSATDRRHVEEDFLLPAAGVVGRAPGVTYNWQSWNNTAVAAVGYTLNDSKLISQALDGPIGFRFQMKDYVIDGFWIEGTWGYQFYALGALTQLAEMAERNGTDLWREEPNLKALLGSPFGLLFPDGTLPAFSDSRVVSIYDQAPLYEYPYAATHDAAFAAVITHGDHPRPEAAGLPFGGNVEHGGRSNRDALLFGASSVPKTALPAMKSCVFPNAGYAALRAPTGDLTEVMKFGPHGGGHGHLDKLSEVIYAEGGLLSVDPGTQFYAVASHDTWDRETVAHNTIVVDEQSQKKATGKLLSWQVGQQFTAVEADAGPVYPGISLRRQVILTSNYILEITSAASTDGLDHTFDWVYHNFGTQELALPTQPWSGFVLHDGYQHLTQNRVADSTADWQDVFRVPATGQSAARGMHLWMLGDNLSKTGSNGGTKVLTGFGLGPDLTVPVPYVMARRRGGSAVFVALMEPFAGNPAIRRFQSISNGVYLVEGPDWKDKITLGAKVVIQHQHLASTHPSPKKLISEVHQ
jgi:hypothetical protein